MTDPEFQAEPNPPSPDFPWPPGADDSAVDALATTWRESIFRPTGFFRRMPRDYDLGWALGYYLIVSIVAAGIGLFWHMVLGPSWFERFLPADADPGNPLTDFLLSPLIALIGIYIVAAVIHLVLLLVRGEKYEYGATLRVCCYSAGPYLFTVIPYLGDAVGGIWSLVITIIGLREAHETTTGKATAAVLVPALLLIGFLIFLFIAVAIIGVGRAVV